MVTCSQDADQERKGLLALNRLFMPRGRAPAGDGSLVCLGTPRAQGRDRHYSGRST